MGTVYRDMVVVFCYDEDTKTGSKTRDALTEFLASYTPPDPVWYDPRQSVMITGACINGELTIVLAPSGSKHGWDSDLQWHAFRKLFVAWAEKLPWAKVLFVEENPDEHTWVITRTQVQA